MAENDNYVGLSKEEVSALKELITTAESEEDSDIETELENVSDKSDQDITTDEDSDSSDLSIGVEIPQKRSRNDVFSWKSGRFCPTVYKFENETCGFHQPPSFLEHPKELDFFECYFTEELAVQIATETNHYFIYLKDTQGNFPNKSRLNQWVETDSNEIYLFLGVTMLISRNKKLKVNDCWSTDPLLHTPIFSKVMPRDRYLLLLRLLHFCDNTKQKKGERTFKIDLVMSFLSNRFKVLFTPFENLCIDESLVLWKERLSFKQYIKSKRHRFGVKMFVLCNVETDYILGFIVYTGSQTKIKPSDLGISGSVVLTLLEDYLDKGHNLYIDNWHSSPELALHLYQHKTNVCGTVRTNRRHMPKLPDPKVKGDIESQHTAEMMTGKVDRTSKEEVKKPTCIVDYNANMGSVDKVDMLLSSVECLRKTIKWYKKIFFHLVDLCMINAHAMYKVYTGNRTTLAHFQLEVIRQIVKKYAKIQKTSKKGRPSSGDNPLRLIGRHFPQKIPPVPGGKKTCQRICFVCKHTQRGVSRRRDTSYQCAECDKALCLIPCFEVYHTKQIF
ncbi:PiggyBac transposable element-derived protein 4-like Protein [Tribolium castaneum]|uniref:PiggyBac transposable element-derived protein 4-like Protein n=1 Tax=Tribolium castaneum TaxID=7070 RepID=D2A2P8_TRICA|nr:PREDICTED: piggyBac transposable element-derived protein 4 [Tribolium castaneum]EFA01473.1 PiggyBac transposable element-derived protein 4-like Protein [Tribolium castaneum]|eukprot:XP_015834342.1 PREDICTED: piggyBac transposable element-derived protein 4 [Tribolium castaneum]